MGVTPRPTIALLPLILIWLPALPLGFALFGECLGPLDKILRREEALEERPILPHGIFDGRAEPGECSLFGEPHAQGGTFQDLVGPALACCQQFCTRNDFIDHADT